MSASAPSAAARTSGAGAIIYNLAGITVLVLILALGAAYGIDRAVKTLYAKPSPDGTVVQMIGGTELIIPQSWLRFDAPTRPGFVKQVDLEIFLSPPGLEAPAPVSVTLLPLSRARASSLLLDTVYLHQFDQGTLTGVPCLIGKPLKPSGGYAGETLWYDALSATPFVAKCLSPTIPDAPQHCLRTVALPSGLAAVYGFEASLLPYWQVFDSEMARWLEKIGAL